MLDRSRRRWAAAALTTVVVFLALGVPTAVVPNPVFGRGIEPTRWSLPVLAVTAVLIGLVLVTYVREPEPAGVPAGGPRSDDGRLLPLDGVPLEGTRRLGVGGVVLLAWTLRRRLATEASCAVR